MLTGTPFFARAVAAIFLCFLMLFAPFRVAAQAKSISQTRINEYAAALLKVHHALIEDTGLRRPGEQLGGYVQRIVQPLPGESVDRCQKRLDTYMSTLAGVTESRNLDTVIPALRDNSRANVEKWKIATRTSAELPAQLSRDIAARKQERFPASTRFPQGYQSSFGHELTKTVLLIKAAFEALRDARP